MTEIGVGIIGSRFMAGVHTESLKRIPGARVVAVASPTEGRAQAFAEKHGIPKAFVDHRPLLDLPDVDMVVVCTPNRFHAPIAIDAAEAGKHIVVEKPLCVNVEEADAMVEAAARAGVKLMYAEEFCFAPQYVRAREIVAEGGVGKLYQVKHVEKYYGPGNPMYWDLETSGGWCAMQLGSHSLGIIRWMLGKPRAVSVYADMRRVAHMERGRGEDDSIIIVNFEDGSIGVAENSWARRGGMDDRMEAYGSSGTIYATLYQEGALRVYSQDGYSYSGPGGAPKQGWTHGVFDELYNNGFPQEIEHFVDCVRHDKPPQETGEDGRAVMELLSAAYESARLGRRVDLTTPFRPGVARPVDCWTRETPA
jgi:myo-inositol 2-dehydrogenase/D-chiro-inositol 1-dehydrogenase